MRERGRTPEEDDAIGCFTEGIITEVTPYSDVDESGRPGGWSVSYREPGDKSSSGTWGCGVKDVGIEPVVGDTIRVYGRFGGTFHGQALNGRVLWYQTPEEQDAAHKAMVARSKQEKIDRFKANEAKQDKEYESLPPTFKERIDKFRRTNPAFRWEYEPYEMMCCLDALKIARYCSINRIATEYEGDEPTATDNVVAFGKLSWEEQKASGVSDGHSGNSFGFAVRLAYLWVTDPGLVVAEHGALTPLVGCDEYGCPHPDAEDDAPEQSDGGIRTTEPHTTP